MGQQTSAPAPLPQVSNPNSPVSGFNLANIKQELPDGDDGIGSMSQTNASIRIKVEPPDESEQDRTVDHTAQHRAFMVSSFHIPSIFPDLFPRALFNQYLAPRTPRDRFQVERV